MKKLCALASLLLAGIILVGCSIMENAKRQEFEERFSRISEVYPTAKAEDLFKKFPKGFKIRHVVDKFENNLNVTHEISLEGKPDTKTIEGTYIKTVYKDEIPSAEEVVRIPISYSDKDGVQTLDGQILEDSVKNIKFFFTRMTIDSAYLSSLNLEAVMENPVSRKYTLRYQVKDKVINEYIGTSYDSSVIFELGGIHNMIYLKNTTLVFRFKEV
ncbi:hypothetical protein ACVRXQ_02795 [Streptococcus panodentis]|uniref:hypothetical protein n=1 Tax=Streptococcus panodentis TaxID=1581472 RepID=UPI001FD886DA|nr:hypothetical protein [Streptococcus panodentis]